MTAFKAPISAQEAEEIAKSHLVAQGLGEEILKRSVKVSRKRKCFLVVFSPPPGVRGGAFTISVDEDGSIQAQRFER